MTVIKVCGITTVGDALRAASAGVDMLGLNFYEGSPRYISVEQAKRIALSLGETRGGSHPILVGLFVNASSADIRRIADEVGLDLIQLSGDESPADVVAWGGAAVKAIRPRTRDEALRLAQAFVESAPECERMPSLILDGYHTGLYGGSGERVAVEAALAVRLIVPRLMLAGGLTPSNVADVVSAVKPWGVDVASGVEGLNKGHKDEGLVRAFVQAVRQADAAGHKERYTI